MPTIFTKGDIFETDGLRAYAFGSNLDGTMDAGIASAMKKRWPELANAYAAHCQDEKVSLGDVFMWKHDDVTVFALGIQSGAQPPKLGALTNAIERMIKLAVAAKIERIGLPRVGTGPGGLDWTRVRKMLGEVSVARPVRLEVFEQFVRARQSDA